MTHNIKFILKHANLKMCVLLFLFLSTVCASAREWVPDRFLSGYEETTVFEDDDYYGDARCTVVRKLADTPADISILYVHGYNDYFFQAHEGQAFVDRGYNFYAVDLRRYGRSLTPGVTPYQFRKVSDYYHDINAAITIMKENGTKRVIIMGHSTGGLIVASYMNASPDEDIKAVILNSPFLDWNMTGFIRKVGIPVISWVGSWWPKLAISQGNSTAYGESLLMEYHGEWEYDTNLKTLYPRKVTAGWIRAITKAQNTLKKHSDIKVPVLLLRSDVSVYGDKWNDAHQHGDAVLNVEHISQIGKTLGPCVTEDVVKGGLHDLALSEPSVRKQFFDDIFEWLDRLSLIPER